jgi:hypothetical protein
MKEMFPTEKDVPPQGKRSFSGKVWNDAFTLFPIERIAGINRKVS